MIERDWSQDRVELPKEKHIEVWFMPEIPFVWQGPECNTYPGAEQDLKEELMGRPVGTAGHILKVYRVVE